jgi:hypothetical protein
MNEQAEQDWHKQVEQLARALLTAANEDGGGTMDRQGQPFAGEGGFLVGGAAKDLGLPADSLTLEAVVGWLRSGAFEEGRLHGHYFGVWYDEEQGAWWLDVVDMYPMLSQAIDIGIQRGERAVWDVAQGCAVPCVDEENGIWGM